MAPSSTGFWSPSWDDPISCGMLTKADNLNCNLSHWRLQRPWLSLWESCQPNRLTERVLRLMVESVYWNVGPSQTAPYGAASSPKGRAKVASLHTMSNKIPFIGTRSRPTWREADSLPYSDLTKNPLAKLQFSFLPGQSNKHKWDSTSLPEKGTIVKDSRPEQTIPENKKDAVFTASFFW